MKPLVYVAGPITNPNPMQNTHTALVLGRRMLSDGYVVPFLPQLSVVWEMVTPDIGYEAWLAYDFDVIRHCQALFRIEGHSPGADREVAFAIDVLDIPVFDDIHDLNHWASAWSARQAVRP